MDNTDSTGTMIRVEPNVSVYVNDANPSGKNPILFLHGWPLSYECYEYQFDELLRMNYRCIGMDLRGFGQSDKPAKGYDYNRMADDIRQVIDTLGVTNLVLAGHSMGGAIAIRYMARHRAANVSKLALFAAAAPSFTRSAQFPYGMTKEQVDQYIQLTYNDRPQMLHNFGSLFFFRYITQPFSVWFNGLGLAAAGWATANCLISLRDETLFADLGKITVPTLILHGIHDQICPYEMGVAQHNAISNSVLIPFEHSGHGLFYDERDKFNKELLQFIS